MVLVCLLLLGVMLLGFGGLFCLIRGNLACLGFACMEYCLVCFLGFGVWVSRNWGCSVWVFVFRVRVLIMWFKSLYVGGFAMVVLVWVCILWFERLVAGLGCLRSCRGVVCSWYWLFCCYSRVVGFVFGGDFVVFCS